MKAWVPMLGRSVELAAVLDRLRQHGRCTIVGPGGVGKSTLARAVGGACGRPMVWIDAEAIDSIAGLAGAILSAFDLGPVAGRDLLDGVATELVERREVLVLDGVEHLVGVSDAIDRLPAGPDAMWLLVTTRRSPAPTPVWRLQPLSTGDDGDADDGGGDAGRLLCELLDALGEPAAAPRHRIADLARETGGLPLAVELLARRLAFGRSALDAGEISRAEPGAHLRELDPAVATSVRRSIDLVDDVAARCFRRLGLTATAVSPGEMAGLAGCHEDEAHQALLQLRDVGLVQAARDRFEVLPPIRDAAIASLEHEDSFETDLDRALDWATDALQRTDGLGDSPDLDNALRLGWVAARARRPGVLRLIGALSGPLRRRMRDGEVVALVEAALSHLVAEPADEAAVAVHAAMAAAGSTSAHDAQHWLQRGTDAARRAGDPPLLRCRIESTRAILALDAGDLAVARMAAEAGVRIAGDTDEAEMYAWVSRHDLALVELEAGDLGRCEALARACVDWGRRHDPDIAQLGAVELAWAALERGAWADAAAQARRLRDEILDHVGHPTEVSEETVTLELFACPDSPLAGPADRRDFAWWPRLTRRVAVASISPLERWRETLDVAADVAAIADALPLVHPGVRARLLIGDAALAGCEWRQAHQAIDFALRTSMRAGYRLRAADALDGVAALALAVDQPRLAHRATGLANATRAWCGAHPWPRPSLPDRPTVGDEPPAYWLHDGMPTEVAVDALLPPLARRIGAPPVLGGAWSLLTRRERDVADLASRGVSNDEIAGELFVSRRTVESHLQRVYRKLDVHSRAELAKALHENPAVGRRTT